MSVCCTWTNLTQRNSSPWSLGRRHRWIISSKCINFQNIFSTKKYLIHFVWILTDFLMPEIILKLVERKVCGSNTELVFVVVSLSLYFRLALNMHVTRTLQSKSIFMWTLLFGNLISVKSVQIIFNLHIVLFVLDHTRWNKTYKRQNESTHFWDMISMYLSMWPLNSHGS